MSLGAGLRLRDIRLVKARRKTFRDSHATLDHKFTLFIGQSRMIISRLLRKGIYGHVTSAYSAPRRNDQ